MDDFKSISVTSLDGVKGKRRLQINNPTKYKLIGHGGQGAVFELTPERCVKIYAKPENTAFENEALKAIEGLPFVPKVFEVGPNYIIMEYLKGSTLNKYLRKKGELPESITEQIVFMFKRMKRAGYKRVDIEKLQHVIITKEGVLKKVDFANAYRKNSIKPDMFFRDLKQIGLLDVFLHQVKKLDPSLYSEWTGK